MLHMLKLIFVFHVGIVSGILITTPRNMAVIAGERMEMKCKAGGSAKVVRWEFIQSSPLNSSVKTIATYNNKTKQPVAVDIGIHFYDNGIEKIYINSTKLGDAGLYQCMIEDNGIEIKPSAQLIVLQSEPICETNLTGSDFLEKGQRIWMRCSVNFSGNWIPNMEWKHHGREERREGGKGEITVFIVNTENNKVKSSFSELTDFVDVTTNDTYFSCTIFFSSNYSTGKGNATNTPDYRYTWNSSVISVSGNVISATTTNHDYSSARDTTAELVTVATTTTVFLVFGFSMLVAFVLALLILVTCYIIGKRKAAEFMASFVANYANVDKSSSRRSMRVTEENQRPEATCDTAGGTCGVRESAVSEGYSAIEDCNEKCSLRGNDGDCNGNSFTAEGVDIVSNSVYDLAEADMEVYATIRKGIEPPRTSSLYWEGTSKVKNYK